MCLDRLEKFPIRQTKKGEAWAWKIFSTDGHRLSFPYYGTGLIPKGGWLKEETYNHAPSNRRHLLTGRYPERGYPYGFHCYLKEADARAECRSWRRGRVVKKVRVRNIVATGIQDNARVLVAKEMYVPKPGQRRVR